MPKKENMIRITVSGSIPYSISIQTDPDGRAEAMYIKFRKNKIYRTVEFSDTTLIDLDRRGNIIGVEMLSPGRVTAKELERVARKYKEPALAQVKPKSLLAGVGI